MGDKKAVPTATVNKKGEVVCPTCRFATPVPETHSLSQGIGVCPACKKRFIVDDDCVAAFHHFLAKSISSAGRHSKEILRNVEDTPGVVKEIQDQISEGGIIVP
jgi:hypothetical protein